MRPARPPGHYGDGLPDPIRKEGFSEAYLRALAASQGVSVIREENDFDGIDLALAARGYVTYQGQRSSLRSPRLGVQLKCSSKHQPIEGTLQHDLPVQNYEALRARRQAMPSVLVVVCVPPDWESRLVWTPDALLLRHCAFWRSLEGAPPTSNRRTCRVTLHQRLSPEELSRIMFLVAEDRPL